VLERDRDTDRNREEGVLRERESKDTFQMVDLAQVLCSDRCCWELT
jgi:hypothetical protein